MSVIKTGQIEGLGASPQKVYQVTSGEYSIKRTHGIFSTRELAQAYIDNYERLRKQTDDADEWIDELDLYVDFNDIQEWTLDQEAAAEVVTVWKCAIVLSSGRIVQEPHDCKIFMVKSNYKCKQTITSSMVAGVRLGLLERNRALEALGLVESVESAEHCKKVAVEFRQRWLSEHDLPEDGGPIPPGLR